MLIPLLAKIDIEVPDFDALSFDHENLMHPHKQSLRVVLVETDNGHARDYTFNAARLSQAADYYPVSIEDIEFLREAHRNLGDFLVRHDGFAEAAKQMTTEEMIDRLSMPKKEDDPDGAA